MKHLSVVSSRNTPEGSVERYRCLRQTAEANTSQWPRSESAMTSRSPWPCFSRPFDANLGHGDLDSPSLIGDASLTQSVVFEKSLWGLLLVNGNRNRELQISHALDYDNFRNCSFKRCYFFRNGREKDYNECISEYWLRLRTADQSRRWLTANLCRWKMASNHTVLAVRNGYHNIIVMVSSHNNGAL